MSDNKLKNNELLSVDSLLKLSQTIDQFEQYVYPHASQMARFAEALALRIGLNRSDLNCLKVAALLHDVGEMVMNSPVMRTHGAIDFRIRIDLWRHPIIGEQQLAKKDLPKQAQLLVRFHHEWWNGTGYPDMLKGEAIPIGARILRLVDTYSSLTADRPHRQAFSETQAQEIIAQYSGIEFDPFLVKIFLTMLTEMSLASEQKIEPTKETITSSNSIQELPQELVLEPIIQPVALETTGETTKTSVEQESLTFEPNNNLEISKISEVKLETTINEINEINEVNEVNEINRVDTGDLETEEIESPTEKIAPLEEFLEDTNATKPLFAINNIETDELSAAQTDLLVEPSPVTAEINETENENFEEMEHISKNNVEN
ncbi:MAG: HD domain-containing protein [Acidobacteria bacterium]|nr:HD domain-containing protein [Acidobacteriota bacterium]